MPYARSAQVPWTGVPISESCGSLAAVELQLLNNLFPTT